jgi:glucokinase
MRAAGRPKRSRGERPRSTSPRPRAGWADAAIGIDLGGTKIALGVVGRTGAILDAIRIPTGAARRPSAILDDIVACVRDRWSERLPRSRPVGVGVAGQVDADGTVLFGPNLNWHDVPLRAALARALGRRVTVLNDVQAAAYGEWKHGAGRGCAHLVCLFVGTGVGGGIVAGGRMYAGASGSAGELGHLVVEAHGRKCRCPGSGCLEAYAGGWAIAERAREAVRAAPARAAKLLEVAGDVASLTSQHVEEAYRARDPLAQELVEETMGYLVGGLVSIVNGLNPQRIVLGGGVLEGFRSMVPKLERQVRRRALPAAADGLRVVPAALGGESGLVGAATFAAGR